MIEGDKKESDKKKILTVLYDSTSKVTDKLTDKLKKSVKQIGDVIILKEKKKKETKKHDINGTFVGSESAVISNEGVDLEEYTEAKELMLKEINDGDDIEIEELEIDLVRSDMVLVPGEKIDELLQDVTIIKEMSKDISCMLEVQGENLEKIEKNISNASSSLDAGNKELDIASKSKNDGIINIIGVSGCSIAGSVFGPPGAAAGAFIGLVLTTAINKLR
jgi:hypothetical protein